MLSAVLCTIFYIQYIRRKIRLIEGNAKCRHLRKLTCKGTLRQGVFICPKAQNPIPYLPNTLFACILYTYSHREEGGVEQREGERCSSSQSWVENTNMTDCISSL
jgi:hypothetical protein